MGRGLAGIRLFQAETDAEDYLDRLAHLARNGYVQVCAGALLLTYFHLLLRTRAQPLPRSMRCGSRARQRFCQAAVTQARCGMGKRGGGRFLGVRTSAVSRSVAGGVSQA